jgi:pilus assembly protein CpaB
MAQKARAQPAMRSYVAAAKAIAAGQVLTSSDLKLISWPAAVPIEGAFTRVDEVTGRSAIYPLEKGQPALGSYLAAPGSMVGLAAKIPEGMRAIALKSNEVIGVAGFLFPGARVDGLVTYRSYPSPQPVTATVLENASVVAVGHRIEPDPHGEPASVNVVTILAKPADAERVVLAGTQGTIHFVLRNGSDRAQVNLAPVNMSEFSPSSGPQRMPRPRTPAAKAKPFVIETILGSKSTFTSFE